MTTVTATTVTAPDTGSRLSARRGLLILLVLCGARRRPLRRLSTLTPTRPDALHST